MNFFERLKQGRKQTGLAPVQMVASEILENPNRLRQIQQVGGPREVVLNQQFIAGEMARLGFGRGLDAMTVRGSYYSELITTCLDQVLRGSSLAVALGSVSSDMAEMMNPKRDIRDRTKLAFGACGAIVNADRKSRLGKLSKDFPLIFEPWIDCLGRIYDEKESVLKNMTSLDRSINSMTAAQKKAAGFITESSPQLIAAGRKYDEMLDLETDITKRRERMSSLSTELVTALMLGDRKVSSLVTKIVEEKKLLASIPANSIAYNGALGDMISATGTAITDTIGVQALHATHRSLVVSRGGLQIAGLAVPMLGLTGIAQAISTASWWSIYTMSQLFNEIGVGPDFSMNSKEIRKAIESENVQARQKFLQLKSGKMVNDSNTQ